MCFTDQQVLSTINECNANSSRAFSSPQKKKERYLPEYVMAEGTQNYSMHLESHRRSQSP
jgi:hypothetical protein